MLWRRLELLQYVLLVSWNSIYLHCTRLFGATSSGSGGSGRGSGSAGSHVSSSLPRLLDSSGAEISVEALNDRLAGKRVAYYFSAGKLCM